MPSMTINECTIHGFFYASQTAYAAAVNCVVDGSSTLVIAKSSVKQLSIPRLKLLGALLLTKLMLLVEKANSITVSNKWLWTDAQIVLDWLSAHPRRWLRFVGDRTSEIIDLPTKYLETHSVKT